jgi:hypothetical protein
MYRVPIITTEYFFKILISMVNDECANFSWKIYFSTMYYIEKF